MTHEDIQNYLMVQQEGGVLSLTIAHNVEQHLKTCADCQAFADMLTDLEAAAWHPYQAQPLSAAEQRSIVAQITSRKKKCTKTPVPNILQQWSAFANNYATAFAIIALFIFVGGMGSMLMPGHLARPSPHLSPNAVTATPNISMTASPVSTPHPVDSISLPSYGNGITCVGTANGANCFFSDGEGITQRFDTENGLQESEVVDIAICPNETIVFVSEKTIDIWKEGQFIYQDSPDWVQFSPIKTVACDQENQVWIAHGFGAGSRVARFDGEIETWTPLELSLEGLHYSHLAVAPDGRVWFISAEQIARIDRDSWEIHKRGEKGMPNVDYTFHGITFDPNSGNPIVIESDSILKFDGEAWKYTNVDNLKAYSIKNIIHADDKLLIASGTNGGRQILLSDNSVSDSDLLIDAREVYAVEQDERGRIYLATSWGLWVFDDRERGSYFMHNSDLVDNRITTIAVLGSGATLPEHQADKVGQVSGRITRHGEPVSNAQVEICVEDRTFWSEPNTPCTNQTPLYTTTTNENGEYVIDDVKIGYYLVAILDGDTWRKTPRWFDDGTYNTNETAFFLIGEGQTNVRGYDLGN